MNSVIDGGVECYVCSTCGNTYHVSNGTYCPYCDKKKRIYKQIINR